MIKDAETESLIITQILVEPDISRLMYELYVNRPDVFKHSIKVAYLVSKVCNLSNINQILIDNKLDAIRGALLHDFGKLDISNKILHKRDKLNEDDLYIIEQHPIYGYNRIKDIDSLSAIVKDIVLHHHENLKGTGYPDQLNDINLITQLVSICDKYDALTEHRSYKKAITSHEALQIIYNENNLNQELFLLVSDCV